MTWPTFFAPMPRVCAVKRPWPGVSSTRLPSRQCSPRRCRNAPWHWLPRVIARPTQPVWSCLRCSARWSPTVWSIHSSPSRWIAVNAPPFSPSTVRRVPSQRTSPASRRPAPPGTRWRWRVSWKTPSCRCAPMSPRSAPGCLKPRATAQLCWPWTRRYWPTRATGWCAKPSASCAEPSAVWTCPRAACLH